MIFGYHIVLSLSGSKCQTFWLWSYRLSWLPQARLSAALTAVTLICLLKTSNAGSDETKSSWCEYQNSIWRRQRPSELRLGFEGELLY